MSSNLVNYQTNPCMVCTKTSVVALDPDKVARWKAGELMQNVWPEFTPDERELLQTGTHPKCWDEMFPDKE